MARNGGRVAMPAVDYETMPFPFAGDGSLEGLMQQLVRRGSAKRGAEICRVFLPEAHIKCSGACHADAIATFAKIVGERGDET
jgi:hypothetical protein